MVGDSYIPFGMTSGGGGEREGWVKRISPREEAAVLHWGFKPSMRGTPLTLRGLRLKLQQQEQAELFLIDWRMLVYPERESRCGLEGGAVSFPLVFPFLYPHVKQPSSSAAA